VVVQHHFADARERRQRVQDLRAKGHVRFHRLPLFGIERAVLIQNTLRDTNLANVVEDGAQANFFDFGALHPHRFRDQRRIRGDFLRVALCVVILGVDRKGQRSDRVQHRLRQRLCALGRGRSLLAVIRLGGRDRFGELPQALVDLFKRFGARRE